VFDKIGKEGRPFGVVEFNRTIRVLDVFGEYLHVVLHGELGWVRYRNNSEFYLVPANQNKEGFDWDKLHIQEIATYYRGRYACQPVTLLLSCHIVQYHVHLCLL
jgi:hypothetical protein